MQGDTVWAPSGGLYVSSGDGSAILSFRDEAYVDVGDKSDVCYRQDDARLQGSFRAQHDDYLHGKVLYIEPAKLLENTQLTLDGNDFHIVGKGLRNPFRMAVNMENGDVYIGDVG